MSPSHNLFGAAVRHGPCIHRWAYAPTVGNLSCLHCGERRERDHPETIAYVASRGPASVDGVNSSSAAKPLKIVGYTLDGPIVVNAGDTRPSATKEEHEEWARRVRTSSDVCNASDQARITELVTVLEWAVAEIEGRAEYGCDGQREIAIDRAHAALSPQGRKL